MKRTTEVGLKDVQGVYGGPEGDLWELIMGEQIHIGGFASSMDLAERGQIPSGARGVDLCCCNGGGMRFLVRFRGVERMVGVDATPTVVDRGRRRCEEEGLAGKIRFILGNACESGLPDNSADFVWGEDAWCYVEDKEKLIRETIRIVRPGGTIAFTDWIEADGLADPEAERYLRFMKFPSILSLADYRELLTQSGGKVLAAQNTGRFAPYVDLYLNMLTMQLTYDALKIIGFDAKMMETLGGELAFTQKLARENKIAQGLFVAKKPN